MLNFKYRLFLFCTFLGLSQWAFAQNEPYTGGIGRGDITTKTNSVYLFSQPANIYCGGSGRGDITASTSISYLNGQSVNNFYRGGIGRGDLSSSSMPWYFNGESANILFTGGNGRGDVKNISNLIYFNGESVNILYAGGSGRGDIIGGSSPIYFNGEFSNILYRGGNGRGDLTAMNDAGYMNGERVNTPYKGGVGRGDVIAKRNLDYLPGGSVFLTLTLFIEGFYLNGGLMRAVVDPINSPTICDVVTVELHDAFSPYNLSYSTNRFINTNGNGNYILLPEFENHSYYLMIKHRNALQTWSALPVLFNSYLMNYSFTDLITKAYGNNMRDLGDGNFAIWSGDINQDGSIDGPDFLELDPAIQNGDGGYVVCDLNGDGAVDGLDFLILDPNIQNGIGAVYPIP